MEIGCLTHPTVLSDYLPPFPFAIFDTISPSTSASAFLAPACGNLGFIWLGDLYPRIQIIL